jgi:hypothetical protein
MNGVVEGGVVGGFGVAGLGLGCGLAADGAEGGGPAEGVVGATSGGGGGPADGVVEGGVVGGFEVVGLGLGLGCGLTADGAGCALDVDGRADWPPSAVVTSAALAAVAIR